MMLMLRVPSIPTCELHYLTTCTFQILRMNWASFPAAAVQTLLDEIGSKHSAITLSQETKSVRAIQRKLTTRAESVFLQRAESMRHQVKTVPDPKEEAVASIVALGFEAALAMRALEACGMSVDDAVVGLLEGRFGSEDLTALDGLFR